MHAYTLLSFCTIFCYIDYDYDYDNCTPQLHTSAIPQAIEPLPTPTKSKPSSPWLIDASGARAQRAVGAKVVRALVRLFPAHRVDRLLREVFQPSQHALHNTWVGGGHVCRLGWVVLEIVQHGALLELGVAS